MLFRMSGISNNVSLLTHRNIRQSAVCHSQFHHNKTVLFPWTNIQIFSFEKSAVCLDIGRLCSVIHGP